MQRNFDQILRMSDVTKATGLNKSTIYRMIKKGSFPKQIKLSENCVGWRISEVENWLNDRVRLSA